MAWPLTGNALAKYNRLLSDLRQYGDMYFVGSPDDITFLYEVIHAASDGQLKPSLDDVANRSHYWMLQLIALFGSNSGGDPCPPCPPCPPCIPLGLIWGPDPTRISLLDDHFDLGSTFDDPQFDSFEFAGLVTIDDEGSGNSFDLNNFSQDISVSFPDLITVVGTMNGNNSTMVSFSAPKLQTVSIDLNLEGSANLANVDLSKLESVGGDFTVVSSIPAGSFEVPELVSVGGFFLIENCPNLVSVLAPKLSFSEELNIFSNPVLAAVSLPSLLSTNQFFYIQSNDALVFIDMPSFVSSPGIVFSGNMVLESVSMPSFVPPDGTSIDFTSNALNDTSVNHILARCVAQPTWGNAGETVDVSGGVSSAPTGQGITDANTLIARGASVTTN